MPTYLSAGVYTKETDLSQVVSTVSTSIGGIVGQFARGPINKIVPRRSTKAFVDMFGKPDTAKLSWPTAYCALAFLERSSNLLTVRVVNSDNSHSYSGGILSSTGGTTALTAVGSAVADPDNNTAIDTAFGTDTNLFYAYSVGPGVYGDLLKIGIRSKNRIVAAPTGAEATLAGGSLAAATYNYRVSAVTEIGEIVSVASANITVTAGVNKVVNLTWTAVPGALYYNVYGRSGTLQKIAQVAAGTTTYTDTGAITPSGAFPGTNASTAEFIVDVYNTEVSNTVPVESFQVTMAQTLDGMGNQQEIETKINILSNLIRVRKNPAYDTTALIYTMAATSLADGADGNAPTATDIANGWELFRDPEQVQVRLLINGGAASPTVHLKMDAIAQARKDCMAILDMPTLYQQEDQAVIYRQSVLNLNSNRSAIYTPDLYVDDLYNGQTIYVPPSGHIAAVYANNDYVAQAWFAPAGLNRGLLSVRGLRYKYNQAARDVLAPAQINYARVFPGQGIAVWEALTMQTKTSALSYVNVRRLLDVVEISVSQALLFSVWEPNDDFLRRQIVGMITEFLDAIRNRRGISDFAVICDDSNNPASLTATGQLNVDVYITPVLPAQKIQLQTVITAQGASFSELIATGGNF